MKKLNNILNILEESHKYWKSVLASGDVSEYNLLNNPNVGDLVFETSAPYKKDIGFGFLLAVDYNSGNPTYWLADCITERIVKYNNCELKKVKNYHISEYDFYLDMESENNNEER